MDHLASKALKKIPSDGPVAAIRSHSLISQLAFAAYGSMIGGSETSDEDNRPSDIICPLKACHLEDEDDCTAGSLASSEERSSGSNDLDGDTASVVSVDQVALNPEQCRKQAQEFALLKWTYLIVTFVVMLADGLQGKHVWSCTDDVEAFRLANLLTHHGCRNASIRTVRKLRLLGSVSVLSWLPDGRLNVPSHWTNH